MSELSKLHCCSTCVFCVGKWVCVMCVGMYVCMKSVSVCVSVTTYLPSPKMSKLYGSHILVTVDLPSGNFTESVTSVIICCGVCTCVGVRVDI